MKTVTVDAEALREVLTSFEGPGYRIRELQVIDKLPGKEGSISKLIRQFNEAIEQEKQTIDLSVCIYNDHKFDVMIKDDEGHEVALSGQQKFDKDVINWLLEVAPCCVFTKYKRVK